MICIGVVVIVLGKLEGPAGGGPELLEGRAGRAPVQELNC